MKPTKQETQELWEKCGLEKPPQSCKEKDHMQVPVGKGDYGDYYCIPVPIDLKNLFKYAVDWRKVETVQFSYGDKGYHCWIYTKKPYGKPLHGNGDTEEDALFWAIKAAYGR